MLDTAFQRAQLQLIQKHNQEEEAANKERAQRRIEEGWQGNLGTLHELTCAGGHVSLGSCAWHIGKRRAGQGLNIDLAKSCY